MHTYCVADWMSKPPILAHPTMSLNDAQHLMDEYAVRRLPVVQNERLVGIITRGDLRAAQPSSATLLSVHEWRDLLARETVGNCMTRDPIAIASDTPVLYAARLMLLHKISGLPVVDNGRVVGVITESDLFRLMIAESVGADRNDARRTMPLYQLRADAAGS
ncbi:MAG TPA: CBS domain-containing protein [Roseiflexaceae bacterium]|nr:CBS domain-containing protein [Roseiflexaceae bacterium]